MVFLFLVLMVQHGKQGGRAITLNLYKPEKNSLDGKKQTKTKTTQQKLF